MEFNLQYLEVNNEVEKIVKIGICMLVGNGKSTLF